MACFPAPDLGADDGAGGVRHPVREQLLQLVLAEAGVPGPAPALAPVHSTLTIPAPGRLGPLQDGAGHDHAHELHALQLFPDRLYILLCRHVGEDLSTLRAGIL